MRSSTGDQDRTIERASVVVVVAVGALLAAIVAAGPGTIGLIVAGTAAAVALLATWSIRRARETNAHMGAGATNSDSDVSNPSISFVGSVELPLDGGRGADNVSAFVASLARRNGGLVDQQLALLDTLEAYVEDPTLLANYFKLDHLATRMRRNADSLLVLAGVDRPGMRSPQAIDEVVRAGISEIEDYRRIDVLALEDVQVTGLAATTLGHLVAELLDNATAFSPPQARVRVAGNTVSTGYEILIADTGIGISDARRDDLNRKLTRPPEFSEVGDASIGLTVVSMLAARIGATVSLSAGDPGGTVATVHIPSSVLHDGELAEPSIAMARQVVEMPAELMTASRREAAEVPAERVPSVPLDVAEVPIASVPSLDVYSPVALEAARAVARLTLTVSGLPMRVPPAVNPAEVGSGLGGTPGRADGSSVFWPPPAGIDRTESGFAPPRPPLRTTLGPLQVAESSDPRPVVEAQPDRIGAALASFARQRPAVFESPAGPDSAAF